ncbi:unnamed protein product [Sympodiomycopsis kandeliae]
MASSSSTLVQGGESLASELHLPILSVKAKQFLRISSPLALPSSTSSADLLAISNRYGLLVAAVAEQDNGPASLFIVHPLKELRKLMRDAEKGSKPELTQPWKKIQVTADTHITTLKLARDESAVVAGLSNGSLAVWNLADIKAGKVDPVKVISISQEPQTILLPNPSAYPDLIFTLTSSSTASLTDLTSSSSRTITADLSGAKITSACWSVKGKQLALGLSDGQIVQVSPDDFSIKATLPKPASEDLADDSYISDLFWIENDLFVIAYNTPNAASDEGEDPPHDDFVFVCSRSKGAPLTYTALSDPSPAFGLAALKTKRYAAHIKGWAPFRNAVFMSSAPSTDVGLIARKEESEEWHTMELEETSRPTLPFSSLDKNADTAPLGMALDLNLSSGSDDEETPVDPKAAARGEDENKKMPYVPPRLWILDSDGSLGAWWIINLDQQGASGCPAMVVEESEIQNAEQGQASSGASMETSQDPTPATAPAKPSAFGTPSPGGFGSSSSSSASAFGSTPAGGFGKPAAFGQASGFGQSTGFGQSSGFGQSTGFGQASAFGQSKTGGSAFGQASAFASNLSPSSSFGGQQSTTPTKPPASGNSSGGFAGFGGSGQSNAFGQAGAGSKPSVFGDASGGSKPSAFGASSGSGGGFGQPSAFGQSSSTPSSSAFGSSASAFGSSASPASGQTSAFGSAPSGNAASTSAFGKPSSGGFGAFGSGRTTSFGAKPSSEAGNSGSIFGSGGSLSSSSSSTTTSAFGSPSAFGQAVKPKTNTATMSEAEKKAQIQEEEAQKSGQSATGFGFGGFATNTESKSGSGSAFGFGGLDGTLGDAVKSKDSSSSTPSIFGNTKTFEDPETKPKSAFGFGSAEQGANKSAFSSFTSSTPPATGTATGEKKSPFGFGSAANNASGIAPKSAFSFAGASSEEKKASDDGSSTGTPSEDKKTSFGFGSTASTPSAFGFNKEKPAVEAGDSSSTKAEEAKKPAFSFGAPSATTPTEEVKAEQPTAPNAGSPASTTQELKEGKSAPGASSTPDSTAGQEKKSPFSFGSTPAGGHEKSDKKDEKPPAEKGDSDKQPFNFLSSKDNKPAFSFGSTPAPGSSAPKEGETQAKGEKSESAFAAPQPPTKDSESTSDSQATVSKEEGKTSDTESAKEGDKKAPMFNFAKDGKEVTEQKLAGFNFASANAEKEKPKWNFGQPAAEKNDSKKADKGGSSPFSFAKASSNAPSSVFGSASQPGSGSASPSAFGSPKGPAFSFGGSSQPVSDAEKYKGEAGAEKVGEEKGTQSPSENASAKAEGEDTQASALEGKQSTGAQFGTSESAKPAATPFSLAKNSGSSSPAAQPKSLFGQPSLQPQSNHSASKPQGFSFGQPAATPTSKADNQSSSQPTKPNFGQQQPFSFAPKPSSDATSEAGQSDKAEIQPAADAKATQPATTQPFGQKSAFGQSGFGSFGQKASTTPGRSSPLSGRPFSPNDLGEDKPLFPPASKPTPFGNPGRSAFGSPAPPEQKQTTTHASQGSAPPSLFGAPARTNEPTAKAPLQSFSGFGKPLTSPVSAPSAQLPPPVNPAPPIAKPGQAQENQRGKSVFSSPMPSLNPSVDSLEPDEVQEKGLQGEFLKTYLIMEKELKVLRSNIAECTAFQAQIRESTGVTGSLEDLKYPDSWAFGDLPALSKIENLLRAQIKDLGSQASEYQRDVAELESGLLKAETKREEAARFLRARTDPEFAKLIRVRQLGPEHAANQAKLRSSSQSVRERIQQVESYLTELRKRIRDRQLGRSQFRAPSLDAIQRTTKNISITTAAKTLELDDLLTELEFLKRHSRGASLRATSRASSATPRRGISAFDDAEASFTSNGTQAPLGSLASIGNALPVSKGSQASSGSVISANLATKLIAARRQPVLNTSANEAFTDGHQGKPHAANFQTSDLQMAFAKGPIRVPASRPAPPPAPAPAPVARPSPVPAAKVEQPTSLAKPANSSPIPAQNKGMFGFAPISPQKEKSKPKEAFGFGTGQPQNQAVGGTSALSTTPKPSSSFFSSGNFGTTAPPFAPLPSTGNGTFNPGGLDKGSGSGGGGSHPRNSKPSRRSSTAVQLPSPSQNGQDESSEVANVSRGVSSSPSPAPSDFFARPKVDGQQDNIPKQSGFASSFFSNLDAKKQPSATSVPSSSPVPTPPKFNFGAFGQASNTANPSTGGFGSGTTEASKSSFGGFGQTASTAKPAFGGFGQTTTPTKPPPTSGTTPAASGAPSSSTPTSSPFSLGLGNEQGFKGFGIGNQGSQSSSSAFGNSFKLAGSAGKPGSGGFSFGSQQKSQGQQAPVVDYDDETDTSDEADRQKQTGEYEVGEEEEEEHDEEEDPDWQSEDGQVDEDDEEEGLSAVDEEEEEEEEEGDEDEQEGEGEQYEEEQEEEEEQEDVGEDEGEEDRDDDEDDEDREEDEEQEDEEDDEDREHEGDEGEVEQEEDGGQEGEEAE